MGTGVQGERGWSVAHEWAAGALTVFREDLFVPGEPMLGPRFMGVLPMPGSVGEAQVLVDRAHDALSVQRAELSSPRWCWVRSQPSQLLTAGRSAAGEPEMMFLVYPPSKGSLLTQSLAVGLPEPLIGLVVLVPTYLFQVEVAVNGRRQIAEAHQVGGDGFPFEEPDAIAAVCAYARSRDGQSGMLGVQAVKGPGRSWRVGDSFADVEASALARTGLPPAVAGAHENADVVLQSMIDPVGLDLSWPWEAEVSRFSVAALLGRLVWQVGYGTLLGAADADVLRAMRDPQFGEDAVGAGWQAVLDDQRGDRRLFFDLLTEDEARFLMLSFVPELVSQRTPRWSEGRDRFTQLAELTRAGGQGAVVDEVTTLMNEVFAAHPHWVAEA